MIVKSETLNALRTGFSKIFEDAKAKAQSQYQQVATVVQSASASTTYGWLGEFPKLREWVGDRAMKNMREYGYVIINKKYESTVNVDRSDIEDDNLGVYTPLVAEMGHAAATHPDEIIFPLLAEGTTRLCYDGKPFFSAEHPVLAADGTTSKAVSNLLTPSTDPGAAWYLLDTARPLRPFIFQERTKPELQAITDPNQDYVFTTDKYPFGIRYRCNGGYGFWQQAICSTEALTAESFEEALITMQSFKADGGRPLGLGTGGAAGLMLVVPVSLQSAALDVVGVQLLGNGGTNKWFGAATILVSPWLTA